MESMQNLFEKYAIYKMKRKEIEQLFCDRINKNSTKTLKVSFVAWKMRLSRLNTKDDLIAFYFMCDNSKNFGAKWWFELTPRVDCVTSSTTGVMQPALA